MTSNKRLALVVAATASLSVVSNQASAQETGTESQQREAKSAWLFLDEGASPSPMQTVAMSTVTLTAPGSTPTRPFASDLARPGGVFSSGAELGLTPWASLSAVGFTDATMPDVAPNSGMSLALRFTPYSNGGTRTVVTTGALRDLSGSTGAWGRLTLTQDIGATRIGSTLHLEHVFTPGRDVIDVMVVAGASCAIRGPLRLGVEYVGQDLEGAFDPEELEGVRHFVGPTVALDLPKSNLSLVAGPAVGLSYASPQTVGKIALHYGF